MGGAQHGDERRRREDGHRRGVHCESQPHPQPYLKRSRKRRANSKHRPSALEALDAHQIAPVTASGARVHAAARSDDPAQPGLCVEPGPVRLMADVSPFLSFLTSLRISYLLSPRSPLPPRPTTVSLQTPPSTATIREVFEIRVREGEFDRIIPQGGVMSPPFRVGCLRSCPSLPFRQFDHPCDHPPRVRSDCSS
ncbi:hypothetical protein K438DRAFT_1943509 [Mycena galopus ATCC 62051]|nr:hypothetical protein K438DRAFT_1943509 [Mycena galopus ATCC 62051]